MRRELGDGLVLRHATAAEIDLPFIARVYQEATRRDRVACVRDRALWRYELRGRREKETRRVELRVVAVS